MGVHDIADMRARFVSCSCGREFRLLASDTYGKSQDKINDMLLDRHNDHTVSMKEQGR